MQDLFVVTLFQLLTARSGRGFGIEHIPGLRKNPGFNLFVVDAHQFQRSHRVVLFSRRTWLMALNLRHHASGNLQPLGQGFERTLQTVDC